jgi:hypothetical protein
MPSSSLGSGQDRTSSISVGKFVIHTDRDHRGRYRGHQAMTEQYRGWHYHIEHPNLSQLEIMSLIEDKLCELGATQQPVVEKKKITTFNYPYRKNLRIERISAYKNRYYLREGDCWIEIDREKYRKLKKVREVVEKEVEVPINFNIGNVELNPKKISYWKLDDKSTVLWISSFNGSLHIEANKNRKYAKNILTKPVLVDLLKSIVESEINDSKNKNSRCR